MRLEATTLVYDSEPKRNYFGFRMVSDNNTNIMYSIRYANKSTRDSAMKRLARRLGLEARK